MKFEDDELSTLGEVRGFLHALEWVNNKCDNGFTFEISLEDAGDDVDTDVAKHFKDERLVGLQIKKIEDGRGFLQATLLYWLLQYLKDQSCGRLEDAGRRFSLSHEYFHADFVSPLIQKIESLLPIESVYEIKLQIKGFYACESCDMLIASKQRYMWLHLDRSD